MKKLAAGVSLLVALTAVAVYAQQGNDDIVRQMKDRAEIEDLMWRYTRALDTRNGDAYAAVYTEDGQFSAGTNVTKGRDALRKMVADMNTSGTAATTRAPMYHMTMNPRVTFVDRYRARIDAYFMTAFGPAGQTPLRVAAVGRSVDELVRQNGKWLIRSRNVAPQQE